MTLALAVVDNGNGTATATISGSSGATNSVYYAAWVGVAGQNYAWVLGGTRTGDGTLTINPGYGSWNWQLLSNGALGPMNYVPTVNASVSGHHYGILQAVQTQILSLNLSSIGSNVILRWVPRIFTPNGTPAEDLPVCQIAPIGAEDMQGLVLSQDDAGYPVVIICADRQQGDVNAGLSTKLRWREQIRRLLINQRLPGTPVWTCRYRPEAIVDVGAFSRNYLVSVDVAQFFVRETRGIT
jgi:hypothetical protein